jgi:hypothetical protein
MPESNGMEELAKAVHDLSANVTEYKKGAVDRQTVENIVSELFENMAGARGRGAPVMDLGSELGLPSPKVTVAREGRQRMNDIVSNDPQEVGRIIGASPAAVERFQNASDGVALLAGYFDDITDSDFYRAEFTPALEAISNTATVGSGADYVPTILSNNLIERVNLDLIVASLFPGVEMPSNPFHIPGLSVSRVRSGMGIENTDDADIGTADSPKRVKRVTPATRKIELNAKKFWAEAFCTKEQEEDAIIAMLEIITEELLDALAADLEDSIINGDTAAALDTAAGFYAVDDPLRNFDGLRKRCPAGTKTDATNTVLSAATLRTNRKRLKKYGTKPSELAHLISVTNYIQLLADPAVLTLDKYGPDATILTGELGKVDGVPVVLSEYVHDNLNATGVYDNVTTNRSLAITVSRRGFLLGNRREMMVEVLRELYSEYDTDAVKVSMRKAFESRFPNTEPTIALTYNLSTA